MTNMNLPFRSSDAGPFGRPQKRERGARIPVIVVTGFLGAGKTTLIRHFLGTPEGAGTAIVVNEFGAIGIDNALLRQSTDAVSLLGNGCVCCVMRSDLQLTLRALIADRSRGAIPDFRRVVIETSGLADPSPILQSFATDRALGDAFHVDVLAAVIDTATGEATLDWSAEARKQVILAERLIVTKTDLKDAEPLIARLRALNSRASIATARNGAIEPAQLIEPASFAPGAFIAEAQHSDGIASFVWSRSAPLRWPTFAHAMETLTALRGPDLLRVKGFLNAEGCSGPVLVQFVQHLAHPPIELQRWPDAERDSRLVFITRDLPEGTICALFAAIEGLA